MSYAISTDPWERGEEPAYVDARGAIPEDAPAQVYRSSMIPLMFGIPVLLSLIGYISGGVQIFADAAFLSLSLICVVLLLIELASFGERQGIGAILIYGGVLIWFCHDYLNNWFLHDYDVVNPAFVGVTSAVVARAMFYHCVFVLGMVIAFRFQVARWVDKLVVSVPEPSSKSFYLALSLAMLLFGWSAFFAAEDPIYIAIPKGALWFIPAIGPVHFSVWRSGNMNYNWGGYVAQIIQVGQMSGILGAFYAIMVTRNIFGKLFGWFIWLYWFLFGIAGERRGEIAFMALPIVGLLFIKFHATAARQNKKRNIRALLIAGVVGACVWYGVAWESAIRFRSDEVKVFSSLGNTMFSEGLRAWAIIPDYQNYAYDTFPGAGIVRPMPETLFWFLIDPIPRALWNDKPIEDFGLWYSSFISGDKREANTGGLSGTTVSSGAVGYWYLRYGPFGVIQGAMLYGWMMGVAERAVRRAHGQPMKLMFALAFATFMFRCYRDLWWHNLYPIMIAGVVMAVIIRMFFSSKGHAQLPAGESSL